MQSKKDNYKRIPEHIIKEINELHKSGFNKTEISIKLGIVISVVSRYTPPVRKNMDKDDKKYIAELYALGKTQIEIGKIVGFSRDTVARATKTLPKRKKPYREPSKPRKIPIPKPAPKYKKPKVVIKKDKPNNSGKEVNITKLRTKERPPVYKQLWIPERRLWVETYSQQEYQEKKLKHGL